MTKRLLLSLCLTCVVGLASMHAQEQVSEKNRLTNIIGPYKPIYFLWGARPISHSKLQLSFKYRLFAGENTEEIPPGNFYFGFTQKSFWDLESDSAPFIDNNYNPELFYLHEGFTPAWLPSVSSVNVQAGYEHESNGEDNEKSRSWDRLYLQTRLFFGEKNKYHLEIRPKVWWAFETSDNPDMHRYMGYGDIEIKYCKPDGIMTKLLLRKGTQTTNGYVELTVAYPLKKLGMSSSHSYAYIQGSWGEVDSLLAYQSDMSFIRIGLALVP